MVLKWSHSGLCYSSTFHVIRRWHYALPWCCPVHFALFASKQKANRDVTPLCALGTTTHAVHALTTPPGVCRGAGRNVTVITNLVVFVCGTTAASQLTFHLKAHTHSHLHTHTHTNQEHLANPEPCNLLKNVSFISNHKIHVPLIFSFWQSKRNNWPWHVELFVLLSNQEV